MIVVSHRGPYRFRRTEAGTYAAHRGAGGVVSALGPLLLDREHEATWIAAALSAEDADGLEACGGGDLGVDLRLLRLDPALHRMHYDVVSNGVLWFVHHGIFDAVRRPRFDVHFREAWDAYVTVNEAFADAAADAAAPRDIVLVQDYQLTLVPAMLLGRRPDLRVVHFTHTPFAGPELIRMLPVDIARSLCESLARCPAGFHTTRWEHAYRASARDVLGPDAAIAPSFAASLGPDADALQEVASSAEARAATSRIADLVGDRFTILRIDRMEPSKNVVRGFLAFDRLLEARPGLRGRVVFLAMLYPSREGLPEYLAYANEIEQAVARVNDRWATRDWSPIVIDLEDDFAQSVAAMERYDVLFVNPIKDGLNLVAKEGPIVNRRDGLLCLSREAGAYEELAPAVGMLQPYDIEQMAVALDDACSTPLDERAVRARRLRELASARSPASWLGDLVRHAGE